jgi:uncharacterized protein
MKYTLCITQECNLACSYCYIPKRPRVMSLETARDAVDFIFRQAAGMDQLEIGFFGGEPLLEFELIRDVTPFIKSQPGFDRHRVGLTVVTNGTIFSDAIAEFLIAHDIRFCLSCDGPPHVQDAFRKSAAGEPSSDRVEATIRSALKSLPALLVNSVYRPETLESLPETIAYLSGLGLRQLYFNPDFSAPWTPADLARLPAIYEEVAERYMELYLRGDPHFISLIDNKIAVIIRGGYQLPERCSMGRREMAFTPDRRIYPCERLIGAPEDDGHCIGSLDRGIDLSGLSCRHAGREAINPECLTCGLQEYCMTWCGCSNYFMTGQYNRVGPFLCASERAAIQAAFRAFTTLENTLGPTFVHHLIGQPHFNSVYLRV